MLNRHYQKGCKCNGSDNRDERYLFGQDRYDSLDEMYDYECGCKQLLIIEEENKDNDDVQSFTNDRN